MEASDREIAISQVYCLLDELKGQTVRNDSHWRGYHPKVYNKGLIKQEQDVVVESLCSKLQNLDVSKYSLEMQMWWRDHQAADKARIEKELAEETNGVDRARALGKLTSHERKLLGL
jgi:hypothetical protein